MVLLAVLPALAKGVPYLIEVESYDPAPVLDEPTSLIISLYDVTDPTARLEDQQLIPELEPIELRHIESGWITRPRFERLDNVSFQATMIYQRVGDWVITTHPDLAERRLIPHQADYPLEFTIEVTPPPAKTETGEWEGVAAVLLFVGFLVLVVVGVSRSRWRHGQPPSPVDVDSPGDTWWSG